MRAKDAVLKLLEALPDDVSIEDIQYHLYVRQKVERGLRDVAEGHIPRYQRWRISVDV